MRVRFLVAASGPRDNRRVGEERDMNDAEAVRLINAGFAEMVRPAGKAEVKTAPKVTEYRKTKGSKRS